MVFFKQLERDRIAVRIFHSDPAKIAGPVKDRKLHALLPRKRQRIEDVEDPGTAATALRARHADKVFNAVTGAGPFGLAVVGVDVHRDPGSIDLQRHFPHRVLDLRVRDRCRALVQAHRPFAGIPHTGAGDNVVEVCKEYVLPGACQLLLRVREVRKTT